MNTNAVLDRVEADLDAARERWFSLLRIPSISAQPAHAADCRAAAEWVREQLAGHGLHRRGACDGGASGGAGAPSGPGGNAPHLLFYGHYDVQPAEPLELWTSPPFEPAMVDGPHGKRVVARGAVDDKGQVMMWLEALRAWHAATGVAAGAGDRADRGRGGGRQPKPRGVPGRQPRTSCRPTSR